MLVYPPFPPVPSLAAPPTALTVVLQMVVVAPEPEKKIMPPFPPVASAAVLIPPSARMVAPARSRVLPRAQSEILPALDWVGLACPEVLIVPET